MGLRSSDEGNGISADEYLELIEKNRKLKAALAAEREAHRCTGNSLAGCIDDAYQNLLHALAAFDAVSGEGKP
jgi:hypothetical protein